MQVHLVDGTYELFRHYYGAPPHQTADGREVGAIRGMLGSLLGLLEEGATHVCVATDHVIESFRNGLFDGYKTGEGIEPELRAQFGPLERVLAAAGFRVWPMVEYEADDALASGAEIAAADARVERAVLCTPDKDLSQCVRDPRIVQLDRRRELWIDEAAVRAKFGIEPTSIPDYLALVGDDADGVPGLRGWGAKSTATVLAHYRHLEAIPDDAGAWEVTLRGAARLAETLAAGREEALLYRTLTTLVRDVPDLGCVDDWAWRGAHPDFAEEAAGIDGPGLAPRAERLRLKRGGS